MNKLVITGGPCAGKTTVLAALREEFGTQLVYVPEAATMLLDSGFPAPGRDLEWSLAWQEALQSAVLPLQRSLESAYTLVARQNKASLMVCDRGVLDGAAYIEGGLEEFCQRFRVEFGAELHRYSAVIHLESLAVIEPERYGKTGNRNRFESMEEAQQLDARTRAAWAKHQRHILVGGKRGIEGKIAEVIGVVKALVQ